MDEQWACRISNDSFFRANLESMGPKVPPITIPPSRFSPGPCPRPVRFSPVSPAVPPPPRQGPCRLTGELSRCIRKYRCMHFACMYLGEQTPGRMDACMHGCLPCMPSRFAHPCRSPTEAVPPALPQRMTWYLPLMFTSEHASS